MRPPISRLTELTVATERVDSTSPPPAAVMWSVGQIAERDTVSKQAVSKKVIALADNHGLEVTRDARRRIIAVNVAQYDLLRERYDDPSKAQAQRPAGELPLGAPSSPRAESKDSREEADRQRAWIDAERARMRLGVERKELLPAAQFNQAIDECGAEIARIIDRLAASTDEIAVAAGRDGAHGVRVLLKSIAQKMRGDIATALAAIAAEAPELEEPQGQQEGLIPGGAGE